ncbi:MAG TPA: DUF423 domain-containing protein [Bryobacteraceae bacterium]|jgi:uncharacterized membrane protein YgdD (TMEM256/DUF423 family)|nr:DUF423 domain-containing protein [Bryobacteraceae bacterium]
MNWTAAGAILMGLGVAIGAFGAHGLEGRLDAYSLDVYKTAVLYHFFHALGLLVVSLMPRAGALSKPAAGRICALLLAGIVIFCGSLYALAISGVRILGAVTPIGGLAFLAAWFWLAILLLRAQKA